MTDPRSAPETLPVGATEAAGKPIDVAGVTPPEQPPMLDDDAEGEINGETDDDLQVQGGE